MIEKYDFVDMSGDLPSGWEERTSRSTGQTYFLNQVDNIFLSLVPGQIVWPLQKTYFLNQVENIFLPLLPDNIFWPFQKTYFLKLVPSVRLRGPHIAMVPCL